MKGATLTLNIIDGWFESEFFDPNNFEPMIEVIVNDRNDQCEHTKTIRAPNNMNPSWKEVLQFDIHKPTDYVIIQIANNKGQKEVLAEKQFVIGEVDQNSDEPLNELKT
jgi:hypothetical protein